MSNLYYVFQKKDGTLIRDLDGEPIIATTWKQAKDMEQRFRERNVPCSYLQRYTPSYR